MADTLREAIAHLRTIVDAMDPNTNPHRYQWEELRAAKTFLRDAALSAPPEQPQKYWTERHVMPTETTGTNTVESVTPLGVESGSGQIEILICEACHSILDPKHWRGMCHCGNGTVREMFTSTHPSGQDTRLLDWLQEEIVNVIELDDGRLIDVRGNSVRDAIRAAIEGEKK